jgi:hypothetical protein
MQVFGYFALENLRVSGPFEMDSKIGDSLFARKSELLYLLQTLDLNILLGMNLNLNTDEQNGITYAYFYLLDKLFQVNDPFSMD